MSLAGKQQLSSRLHAIKQTPLAVAKKWADADVKETRRRIKRRTGKTADSVKVGRVTATDAQILGSEVVNFLDAGTRAHDEVAHNRALKFQVKGRTMFAPKVHKRATKGSGLKQKAAVAALKESPMATEVVRLWNNGA